MRSAVSLHLAGVFIALLAPLCNALASEPPTSPRAEAVIAARTPGLAEALADKGLRLGAPVYIAIFKTERALELWSEGPDGRYRLFRTYGICKMSGNIGPKLTEGDNQAPEGFYDVEPERLNPESTYHLAFDLGYPNAYDRALGRTGSLLMVHGDCVSIGCYAMTDAGIEEIYTLVHAALAEGMARVQVHVFPFRMTPEQLARHERSRFYAFWLNLKEGYDLFQTSGRPPLVGVGDGRYYLHGQ